MKLFLAGNILLNVIERVQKNWEEVLENVQYFVQENIANILQFSWRFMLKLVTCPNVVSAEDCRNFTDYQKNATNC